MVGEAFMMIGGCSYSGNWILNLLHVLRNMDRHSVGNIIILCCNYSVHVLAHTCVLYLFSGYMFLFA
jgi:hypothetical protein